MKVSLSFSFDKRKRIERLNDRLVEECELLTDFEDKVAWGTMQIERDDWVGFGAGDHEFVQFFKQQDTLYMDIPIVYRCRTPFYYYDVVRVLHEHEIYPYRPIWVITWQKQYYRKHLVKNRETGKIDMAAIQVRLGKDYAMAGKLGAAIMERVHEVDDAGEITDVTVGTVSKNWFRNL